jgi:hypothetical protein
MISDFTSRFQETSEHGAPLGDTGASVGRMNMRPMVLGRHLLPRLPGMDMLWWGPASPEKMLVGAQPAPCWYAGESCSSEA